jgi:integrase
MFLYIAYYLGLRRGEILGLTWGRVYLDTLEVRVLAPTSKGRSERVVPISPEMGGMLQQWKSQQTNVGPKDPVLPWPYDTYRKLYDDWHRIQKAAGIADGEHYVPKNCRSTCASELIAANVPTVVVKDFLGHASVATTEGYYINTKPALRAAATARKVLLNDGAQPPVEGKTPSDDWARREICRTFVEPCPKKCESGDSNPDPLRDWILSPARLPIPPLSLSQG